jgi:hypothetical protein
MHISESMSNYFISTFYRQAEEKEYSDIIDGQSIFSNIELDTDKPCEILQEELEKEYCAITLTPLKDCTIRAKLPCSHHFSALNIQAWLKDHKTCPTCRDDRNILQYYVTASKIQSTLPYLTEASLLCKARFDKNRQEADIKLEDSRIAYPIKIYQPLTIAPGIAPEDVRILKPEFECIVKSVGFRTIAVIANIVQYLALIALPLMKALVVISTVVLMISAHGITILSAGFALGFTLPVTLPVFIYNRFVPAQDRINIVRNALIIAQGPGKLFLVMPITYIGFFLEKVLNVAIDILSTRHTPKSIWNHSLTVSVRNINNNDDNDRIIDDDNDIIIDDNNLILSAAEFLDSNTFTNYIDF